MLARLNKITAHNRALVDHIRVLAVKILLLSVGHFARINF
jgi:hypothetical protein